ETENPEEREEHPQGQNPEEREEHPGDQEDSDQEQWWLDEDEAAELRKRRTSEQGQQEESSEDTEPNDSEEDPEEPRESESAKVRRTWKQKIRESQTSREVRQRLGSTRGYTKVKGLYLLNGKAIIPRESKELIQKIMEKAHMGLMAAHQSAGQMLQYITDKKIFVEGAKEAAKAFIQKCGVCQKRRLRRSVRRIMRNAMVDRPFQIVAVDTIGPLRMSRSGARHIIVMVDCFTRYTVLVPTSRCTAEEAAEALVKHWVVHFGLPETIKSDQGKHLPPTREWTCGKDEP
ncbi:hypothetical protein ADUPG1_012127, partial [Aduncisulcus paluster]